MQKLRGDGKCENIFRKFYALSFNFRFLFLLFSQYLLAFSQRRTEILQDFLKYCIYFTILGDKLFNVIALQNFVLLCYAVVYALFFKKRFAKFIFLHRQIFAQCGLLLDTIRKFFVILGGGGGRRGQVV